MRLSSPFADNDFGGKQADREGRACYLESSNDINPHIYGKMGFKVIKEICLRRDKEDIRMDIMVREPVQIGQGKEQ